MGRRLVGAVAAAVGLTGVVVGSPAAPAAQPEGGGPVVTVDTGDVVGVVDGSLWSWRGVPYAAPPLGERRWLPPARHEPWAVPFDASSFAEPCIQWDGPGATVGAEDCLRLNVFAPAGSGSVSDLPVMVQLHPGGNVFGRPYQEARQLVDQGVVVVTVAYRLGVFGWLGHADLSGDQGGFSGEYASQDQLAALRWVRRNIDGFGGDAGNVTVIGSSAGSFDAAAIVASPRGRGLVQRAILQTTAWVSVDPLPVEVAELDGQVLADEVGCGAAPEVVACLRDLPAADLVEGYAELGIFDNTPWVGGRILPRPLLQLLRQDADPVPLIVGSDRHERTVFEEFFRFVVGDREFRPGHWRVYTDALLGPALGPEVRRRYPVAEYRSHLWAAVDAASDALHVCPARQVANAAAGPVYRYVYRHTYRNDRYVERFRASHIFEDALVWGDPALLFTPNGPYEPTPAEAALGRRLARRWTSFARTGEPNAGGLLDWPEYLPGDETILQLGIPDRQANAYHRQDCAFWAGRTIFPESSGAEAGRRQRGDSDAFPVG